PSRGPPEPPGVPGRSGRQAWAETWHPIGPMIDRVMAAGEASWSEDILMFGPASVSRAAARGKAALGGAGGGRRRIVLASGGRRAILPATAPRCRRAPHGAAGRPAAPPRGRGGRGRGGAWTRLAGGCRGS